MLSLYTVFHLNMLYSSIEEESRRTVIDRCYWPLLRLVEEQGIPLGIEAPGSTLEIINDLDPAWVEKLRDLLMQGRCEFVGSGHAQVIGPLAPALVNHINLALGKETYRRLLGVEPPLALVNEQAYSAGLVDHYLQAGYAAMMMDWNNPASTHKAWPREWRFLPQRAASPTGATIPVVWSDSIFFQKVQRYAFGELDLEEFTEFLHAQDTGAARALPLYTNDAEVFDYRPGRFHTETAVNASGEWERLRQLFHACASQASWGFVRPSAVLNLLDAPHAGNVLRLETPEDPIPVKKQRKYNVTRWSVTGRNNVGINTQCWRVYRALECPPERWSERREDWRELCLLWDSDFRTHITSRRWAEYHDRLGRLEARVATARSPIPTERLPMSTAREGSHSVRPPEIRRTGDLLVIDTNQVSIRLNCRRGLAIDALRFTKQSDIPVVCTLPHGYYDDISLAADFYSGHMVLDLPGRPKITDLNAVEPTVSELGVPPSGTVVVRAQIETAFGPVNKTLRVHDGDAAVELSYEFQWTRRPLGSLRVGMVTLNPKAFNRDTVFFRCHNGGYAPEVFTLLGRTVEHDQPVSALVSASAGLGDTTARIELGDARLSIAAEVDRCVAAVLPLVTYREVDHTFFYRLSFSLGEMDEARLLSDEVGDVQPFGFSLVLRPAYTQ